MTRTELTAHVFLGLAGPLASQEAAVSGSVTAPLLDAATRWTGAYAGFQLGYGDTDSVRLGDGSGALGGVHLGYNYDFGRLVLGAELDYDITDLDFGSAGDIDSFSRLKFREGYDFGRVLGYRTVGFADADTSLGDDTGGVCGIGFFYRLDNGRTVGAEVVQYEFDGLGSDGDDLDATTITLRGSNGSKIKSMFEAISLMSFGALIMPLRTRIVSVTPLQTRYLRWSSPREYDPPLPGQSFRPA